VRVVRSMRERTNAPQTAFCRAGSIGSNRRTTSISPKVEDPGYRAVTFDQMAESYYQQCRSLGRRGVDILFPETTFDTLNFEGLPVCDSAVLRRTQSSSAVMGIRSRSPMLAADAVGQTIEAFWNSVSTLIC